MLKEILENKTKFLITRIVWNDMVGYSVKNYDEWSFFVFSSSRGTGPVDQITLYDLQNKVKVKTIDFKLKDCCAVNFEIENKTISMGPIKGDFCKYGLVKLPESSVFFDDDFIQKFYKTNEMERILNKNFEDILKKL